MSGSGSTIYALFEDEPEQSGKAATPTALSLPDDLATMTIFNDVLA